MPHNFLRDMVVQQDLFESICCFSDNEKINNNSAGADGVPRSRVCTRTLSPSSTPVEFFRARVWVPKFFHPIFFCYLKLLAYFQNPRTTPSRHFSFFVLKNP